MNIRKIFGILAGCLVGSVVVFFVVVKLMPTMPKDMRRQLEPFSESAKIVAQACYAEGSSSWVLEQGTEQVGRDRAVQGLIELLGIQDKGLRGCAAHTLGFTHDPKVMDVLVGTLRDKTPYVRTMAANGLGELGDPRAIEHLSKMAESEDDRERSNAGRNIEKLKKIVPRTST